MTTKYYVNPDLVDKWNNWYHYGAWKANLSLW